MTTLTFDANPPRRPGIGDVGGGQKEDDVEFPPDPVTMPTADDFNQLSMLAVAYGKVLPAAILHVAFPGGTPTIMSCYALGSNVVAGDFILVDNGNGDTSITHSGGKLPPQTWPPFAVQVDDTEIDRIRTVRITHGARVKTKLSSTGTDAEFLLFFSGI